MLFFLFICFGLGIIDALLVHMLWIRYQCNLLLLLCYIPICHTHACKSLFETIYLNVYIPWPLMYTFSEKSDDKQMEMM
jgi:hypothetical protein